MADQTVKVANMPDSGSREMVAFRLWERLNYLLPNKEGLEGITQQLDLYATCLSAAGHGRKGDLA